MAEENNKRKAEWLEPPVEEEGLRRYVETIRERLPLVVLAVVITTAMAVMYVLTAPKTYEARADLLVTPLSGDDAVVRTLPVIVESTDPTRDVETASQFVTNINVAGRVMEDLGLSDTPRDLLDDVTAEPVAQSNIVAVTAEAPSAAEAQELANAFVAATVEERTEQVHAAIDSVLPSLEAQLGGDAAGGSIASQITQFETLRAGPDPSIRIQTEADLPDSQASPRPLLSVAGGVIAGLVLGIAGAFASQNLDPRLRRESQLRRLYNLPILSRIPREPGRVAGGGPLSPKRISQASVEAYRTLRATLENSGSEGSRVILVTGPSPAEGKSTTAVNLASSLALAGCRVILIEADLRRPSLGQTLDAQPSAGGVVSVLIERVKLEEALTTSPSYGHNLRALLADYEGGWIAELFSIPAAQKMIEDARRLADYVVIDSPPLNEVVDALPLARAADDVAIVVRLGKTKLQRLAELGELLAENGIKPAGFTVVGVPRPRRGEYHYYHPATVDGKRDRSKRSLFEPAERQP